MCQSLLLSGGVAFDTHQNNIEQHEAFNGLFETLSLLSAELESAGLWDETVVLITSDFTRTPKRNNDAGKRAKRLWTEIAGCLERVVTDGPDALTQASDLLVQVADVEGAAVEELNKIMEGETQ